MHLCSDPTVSPPASVCAPKTTLPALRNCRRQFTPIWFRPLFYMSIMLTSNPITWLSVVVIPTGAFHTPREAFVEAKIPATKPRGGK